MVLLDLGTANSVFWEGKKGEKEVKKTERVKKEVKGQKEKDFWLVNGR